MNASRRFSLINPLPLAALAPRVPGADGVSAAAAVSNVSEGSVTEPLNVVAPIATSVAAPAVAVPPSVQAPPLPQPNVKAPPRTRFVPLNLAPLPGTGATTAGVGRPDSPQLAMTTVRPTWSGQAQTFTSAPSAMLPAPNPVPSATAVMASSAAAAIVAPPPAAPAAPPHAPQQWDLPTSGYGAGFRPLPEHERQLAAAGAALYVDRNASGGGVSGGGRARGRTGAAVTTMVLPESDDAPFAVVAAAAKGGRGSAKATSRRKPTSIEAALPADGAVPEYSWFTESSGRRRGGKGGGRRVLLVNGQRYTGTSAHKMWTAIKERLGPSQASKSRSREAKSDRGTESAGKKRASKKAAARAPHFSPPAVALSFGTTPSPMDAPLVAARPRAQAQTHDHQPSARAAAAVSAAAVAQRRLTTVTLSATTASSTPASTPGGLVRRGSIALDREESLGSHDSSPSEDSSEIPGEFDSFIVDDDDDESDESSLFEDDWESSSAEDTETPADHHQRPGRGQVRPSVSSSSSSTVDTDDLVARGEPRNKRHRPQLRAPSAESESSDVVIASGPARRPDTEAAPQLPSLYGGEDAGGRAPNIPQSRPLGGMIGADGRHYPAVVRTVAAPTSPNEALVTAFGRYNDSGSVDALLVQEGDLAVDEVIGGYTYQA